MGLWSNNSLYNYIPISTLYFPSCNHLMGKDHEKIWKWQNILYSITKFFLYLITCNDKWEIFVPRYRVYTVDNTSKYIPSILHIQRHILLLPNSKTKRLITHFMDLHFLFLFSCTKSQKHIDINKPFKLFYDSYLWSA